MTRHLKHWILSLGLVTLVGGCAGETGEPPVVEAACGQCQFDLPGEGCDLAVRIGGDAYFVQGTSIDEHGDAHAQDGFCNAIRSARVEGRIEADVFVATSFALLSNDG